MSNIQTYLYEVQRLIILKNATLALKAAINLADELSTGLAAACANIAQTYFGTMRVPSLIGPRLPCSRSLARTCKQAVAAPGAKTLTLSAATVCAVSVGVPRQGDVEVLTLLDAAADGTASSSMSPVTPALPTQSQSFPQSFPETDQGTDILLLTDPARTGCPLFSPRLQQHASSQQPLVAVLAVPAVSHGNCADFTASRRHL